MNLGSFVRPFSMAASPSHSVQLVQFVLGWLDPSWFAEAGDWHLLRTLGHSLGSSTTGQSSGAGASDTIVLGPGGVGADLVWSLRTLEVDPVHVGGPREFAVSSRITDLGDLDLDSNH